MMPRQVMDLLIVWRGVFGHHKNKVVGQATLHCLMWMICRERNCWNFEKRGTIFWRKLRRVFRDLFFFFLIFSFDRGLSCSSIVDVLDHMNVCL